METEAGIGGSIENARKEDNAVVRVVSFWGWQQEDEIMIISMLSKD